MTSIPIPASKGTSEAAGFKTPNNGASSICLMQFSHDELLDGALQDLQDLQDGWMDGEGLAPQERAIADAEIVLRRLAAECPMLASPRIFPVLDGSVQAEWSGDGWLASARFSSNRVTRVRVTRKGEVFGDSVATDDVVRVLLDRFA